MTRINHLCQLPIFDDSQNIDCHNSLLQYTSQISIPQNFSPVYLFHQLFFYSILIQMHDNKENDLWNFTKMLRKLEMENVGLPELRQLKQEHSYLEKLRQQRSRIEELKAKYDQAEAQLADYIDENISQRQLIEEQHRTIQLLEEKLAEVQRKRHEGESNIARTLETERERHRIKINELIVEIQEVKKQSKKKDLLIFELEDEMERKLAQHKEHSLLEKKRFCLQWEEKHKSHISQLASRSQQNQQLRELVTRQHKALELQNDQYEETSRKNEELSEAISELQSQLEQVLKAKGEAEERLTEMADLIGRMEGELDERRCGANAKEQIDELRKRMGELAKGEIERIQFIVNEFQ